MRYVPYRKIALLLSMGAMMLLLGGWTISKTADTKELNSDSIEHYYSYDPDTYSYNYITELNDQNNLIKQLNQVISLSKEERLAKETVVGGFLLVGKNGDKTEYYLSSKGLYNEDNKVFSIPEEPQNRFYLTPNNGVNRLKYHFDEPINRKRHAHLNGVCL